MRNIDTYRFILSAIPLLTITEESNRECLICALFQIMCSGRDAPIRRIIMVYILHEIQCNIAHPRIFLFGKTLIAGNAKMRFTVRDNFPNCIGLIRIARFTIKLIQNAGMVAIQIIVAYVINCAECRISVLIKVAAIAIRRLIRHKRRIRIDHKRMLADIPRTVIIAIIIVHGDCGLAFAHDIIIQAKARDRAAKSVHRKRRQIIRAVCNDTRSAHLDASNFREPKIIRKSSV